MFYLNINFDFFHFIVILAFSLLTHGIIMLNDGLYWDGWMIDTWQRRKDWKPMKRFFSEVGMPLFYYQHKLIAYLPLRILFYRILAFISTFMSAFAVYLIASNFDFLSNNDALLLALLYLSYTGYHMNVDINVGLQYTFPTAVFYSACFVALFSESQAGSAYWALRVISLGMFFLSFNANSILVYFFGFLALKGILYFRGNEISLANFMNFTARNSDYLLLPFIFWFIKEKYTPRHGYYINYNRINLNISKIKNGFMQLFRTGLVGILKTSFIFLLRRPVVLMTALIFYFVFLIFVGQYLSFDSMLQTKAMLFFLYGILLLILGGLPYILVGQPFGLRGWSTRNNMLLALPVALIILGTCNLFLKTAVVVPFLIILLIVSIIYLNYIYLSWIALWVKYRSMLFNLKKIPSAKDISIYGFCDLHPISGSYDVHPEYGPIHLVCMFAYIWGDMSRLGIAEVKPRINGYTQQEILVAIKETTLDYALNRIDRRGKQAMLIIRQGDKGLSEMRTAIYYLIFRFIRKDKMDQYLAGITEVELIPLNVPA